MLPKTLLTERTWLTVPLAPPLSRGGIQSLQNHERHGPGGAEGKKSLAVGVAPPPLLKMAPHKKGFVALPPPLPCPGGAFLEPVTNKQLTDFNLGIQTPPQKGGRKQE